MAGIISAVALETAFSKGVDWLKNNPGYAAGGLAAAGVVGYFWWKDRQAQTSADAPDTSIDSSSSDSSLFGGTPASSTDNTNGSTSTPPPSPAPSPAPSPGKVIIARPTPGPIAPPGNTSGTPYLVHSGDTLSAIAAARHKSWHDVYESNQEVIDSTAHAHGCYGHEYDCIYPGEQIYL